MMTYVTAFIFYTLAMIGILLIGFVVYKKVFETTRGENRGLIKILDSSPIGNKKLLLIVQVKNERFLIASGAEHTTFLAKLSNENSLKEIKQEPKMEDVINQDFLNEAFKEIIAPEEKEIRYDDVKKTRALELQRQFNELYEKEENNINFKKQTEIPANERKRAIKELLGNFNFNENINTKNGSKF